ncbi:MAG: metalloprotease PmbA [Burkholderiaceae bacterium]|nr:metalloprotease PmbA [Burkholderiaceae bacterium]
MSENLNLSNYSQMQTLVEEALCYAKEKGASDATAEVSEDSGLNVNVRGLEAETIEYTHDRNFSVTVYIGKRSGSASSGDLKPEAIRRTVQAALDIARYTSEDHYCGLPEVSALCSYPKDLNLYHPWNVSVDDAIDLCVQSETSALNTDSRIVNSDGISLNSTVGRFVLGNTKGFLSGYPYSTHSIYASVIAKDKNGMQRDGWYSMDVVPQKLCNARELGRIAAQRAVSKLSPQTISPRKCPVIFEAPVAKTLINTFNKAIAGSNLYHKSSFLLNKLYHPVMSDGLSLYENPFVEACYGSAPFDEEGVSGSERFIVKDGVLQNYYLNSYSARKLNMETTGNAGGPYNVYLQCQPQMLEPDLQSLIKRMHYGLLVTEVSGQGINLTNGDYSQGASGFWIENGKIAYPVDGITIAGNLRDIFLGVQAIAEDLDCNGSIVTGSILVEEMTIAGNGSD